MLNRLSYSVTFTPAKAGNQAYKGRPVDVPLCFAACSATLHAQRIMITPRHQRITNDSLDKPNRVGYAPNTMFIDVPTDQGYDVSSRHDD